MFNGHEYNEEKDGARLASQIERIFGIMQDHKWRTLAEISDLSGDPESSISAQLRNLRKVRFGGYLVESRRRHSSRGLWEYRVTRKTGNSTQTKQRRTKIDIDHFLKSYDRHLTDLNHPYLMRVGMKKDMEKFVNRYNRGELDG